VKIARHQSGFTLIELLTVLAIAGILAALVVPALKNVGNGNATVSATRQLLDDVARARQLAISQHTTVYMVFVPTNFWGNLNYNNALTSQTWLNNLTVVQRTAATNLCDEQMTGYTFVTMRSMGDQPGQGTPHYLAPWQNLPDGTFIVTNKFDLPGNVVSSLSNPFFGQWNQDYPHSDQNKIYAFSDVAIPFPTVDTTNYIAMPCIAFNYLGQLAAGRDEYIPLAHGSVLPAIIPATKALQFSNPDVTESPPGNSTNIYNIIHIDWLTGRARVEQPKVQ